MAINPNGLYPTKTAAPSPEYPYGAARNVVTPGDATGTPWKADVVNDLWGFLQSVLDAASIAPSGDPDEVGASQYLEGLDKLYRPGGWTTPTYVNAWTAYDGVSVFRATHYRKEQDTVYISGAAVPGSGTVAFYLPVEFRPALELRFAVTAEDSGGNPLYVTASVRADGGVAMPFSSERTASDIIYFEMVYSLEE